MSVGRRVALVLLGVVVVTGVVLGGIGYFALSRSDRLLAAAGRALGRELHADGIGVLFGTAAGVRLTGVRIADDPAFDANEAFVTAKALEMRVRLLPLLRGRVVVDRIVIDEPVVRFARNAEGKLNLDSLRARAKARKRDAQSDEKEKQSGPPPFQLALLTLRDGTIRFDDQGSKRSFVLGDVRLDIEQPELGAPMPISVHARIEGRDVRLDGLVSEGAIDLTSESAWYSGTVHADGGALGPLEIGAADAQIQLRPPAMMLQGGKVAFLGGRVTGWARVQSGGEGQGFRAEIDGRDLDLAGLPAREGRAKPAGKLAFHTTLGGPVPGGDDFLAGLSGDGRFEVAQGRIANLPIGRAVSETLGPVVGPDKIDRLRTRYPDVFAGDDFPFVAFSGSAHLGDKRLSSEDFVLAGASYQARGTGTLGLDGALDATLRLAASAALTDDLLGHSQARPVLVDERGLLVVPLHVGGTLQHARVTPAPEFVGQAARAVLGGSLGEAAAGALNKLLGGKKQRQKQKRAR